jgi:hypothetical protein
MKYFLVSFLASLLLFSCKKQSEISKSFKCNSKEINNLEAVTAVKNLFTVQLPKTWKTNLFFDEVQSSIYSADTTKQLTETVLLDITFINNTINFNALFKLKQEKESFAKNLLQTESKEITLLNKPSCYTVSKGKKGSYSYKKCEVFIKINEENFMLAKVEIYGDSLVNERMCTGILLIEKIKIHQ